MDTLAFAPLIDFPLAGVTAATFIWHFNRWALRRDIDTAIDISTRLPTARYRVILLFASLLLLCWFLDLAFWSIFALLLGIGLVIAVVFGGDIQGSAFGLWAAAYLIREWAFGFPQLILHPQPHDSRVSVRHETLEILLGKTGVTISPLRPTGDAEIDGLKHSVVSYDGGLLDPGTKVTVMSYRNGYPCVSPMLEPDKSGEPYVARENAS